MAAVVLSGSVPIVLRGRVMYRVGPAQSPHGRAKHNLDMDGKVERITFRPDGGVDVMSRCVETEYYTTERDARRTLYKCAFDTGARVGGPVHRNPANESVFAHAGRLFASSAVAGPPYIISPNLDTLGREAALCSADPPLSTSIGALDHLLGVGGHSFGAHPTRCPVTGRLVNTLSQVTPFGTNVTITEYAVGSWRRVKSFLVRPGFTFVSAILCTPQFYVFFAPRLKLGVNDFVTSTTKGPAECVAATGHTRLCLTNRYSGRTSYTDIEGVHIVQTVHAFEDATHVVVDAVVSKHISLGSLPLTYVERFCVCARTGDVVCRTVVDALPAGFVTHNPHVAGRQYEFAYYASFDGFHF